MTHLAYASFGLTELLVVLMMNIVAFGPYVAVYYWGKRNDKGRAVPTRL
jgi:hypothetical protein